MAVVGRSEQRWQHWQHQLQSDCAWGQSLERSTARLSTKEIRDDKVGSERKRIEVSEVGNPVGASGPDDALSVDS